MQRPLTSASWRMWDNSFLFAPSAAPGARLLLKQPGDSGLSARQLTCGAIQSPVCAEDLVNEANVIACLLETDHFQQQVRVIASQVPPGDRIARSGVVRG